MARTILLDYETDSLERFREVGEIIGKVDRGGVPVHEAMGEPEPPAPTVPSIFARLMGQGEQ